MPNPNVRTLSSILKLYINIKQVHACAHVVTWTLNTRVNTLNHKSTSTIILGDTLLCACVCVCVFVQSLQVWNDWPISANYTLHVQVLFFFSSLSEVEKKAAKHTHTLTHRCRQDIKAYLLLYEVVLSATSQTFALKQTSNKVITQKLVKGSEYTRTHTYTYWCILVV